MYICARGIECEEPRSLLGVMFNGQNKPDKDKDGCYFIDRSGQYFDHILNHLRDGTYLPPSDILTEGSKQFSSYM
jgi:hypothetical protein